MVANPIAESGSREIKLEQTPAKTTSKKCGKLTYKNGNQLMTNTWYWLPGFKGTKQTSTVMKSTALLGPSIMIFENAFTTVLILWSKWKQKWRFGFHTCGHQNQYGRPRAGSKCTVVQRGWGDSRTLSRNIKLIFRGPHRMVQQLGVHLPAWGYSMLVRELRSHMLWATKPAHCNEEPMPQLRLNATPNK